MNSAKKTPYRLVCEAYLQWIYTDQIIFVRSGRKHEEAAIAEYNEEIKAVSIAYKQMVGEEWTAEPVAAIT